MERKAPPPDAQAADAGAQKPAVATVGGAPGSGMQNAQDSDDCPAQELQDGATASQPCAVDGEGEQLGVENIAVVVLLNPAVGETD